MMRRFAKSMRHALRGLVDVARAEQSFRLQLVAAFMVVATAVVLPLATWERILLLLMAAAVLVLEVMNSIVERLADAVQPRLSPMVREIKDMMAGTVLITAVTATVVATLILWPYIERLLLGVRGMLY